MYFLWLGYLYGIGYGQHCQLVQIGWVNVYLYRGSSFYEDSVYTSSKNFVQSEELLIKSAVSEFRSNFSISDSLYAIFTLRKLPWTQNSRKERTPCSFKFQLEAIYFMLLTEIGLIFDPSIEL